MTISLERLEWIARLLADTKKTVSYQKHEGTWAWVDRDREHSTEDYHKGFKTWLDAAEDAVEPYLNKENDEP